MAQQELEPIESGLFGLVKALPPLENSRETDRCLGLSRRAQSRQQDQQGPENRQSRQN